MFFPIYKLNGNSFSMQHPIGSFKFLRIQVLLIFFFLIIKSFLVVFVEAFGYPHPHYYEVYKIKFLVEEVFIQHKMSIAHCTLC